MTFTRVTGKTYNTAVEAHTIVTLAPLPRAKCLWFGTLSSKLPTICLWCLVTRHLTLSTTSGTTSVLCLLGRCEMGCKRAQRLVGWRL